MYKQCFELLTAQGKNFIYDFQKVAFCDWSITSFLSVSLCLGPKPHKSFSVASGSAEVAKEYDAELKSNIFSLSGQRIQLPPNPSQQH